MLHEIASEVWEVTYDHHAFGLHFPGRMTIVRLPSGGLWLHSPVPIDDALADQIAELGSVEHLVAPNLFHHCHLGSVMARYPQAQLHGPAGFAKKRPDLDTLQPLQDEPPADWGDVIEQVHLRALPALRESVFFHRPSGTLVTTDLFMNVHEAEGVFSRFTYWAEGCWKRPRVPRLISFLVKDKASMREDAERLLAFGSTRVILAHGERIDDDAQLFLQTELSRAFGAGAIDPAALQRGP